MKSEAPVTADATALIGLDQHLHVMRTGGDLAAHLGVSPQYIRAMKNKGFKMPGGKASIAMAREFLKTVENLEF